jgi:hypothetical protein
MGSMSIRRKSSGFLGGKASTKGSRTVVPDVARRNSGQLANELFHVQVENMDAEVRSEMRRMSQMVIGRPALR